MPWRCAPSNSRPTAKVGDRPTATRAQRDDTCRRVQDILPIKRPKLACGSRVQVSKQSAVSSLSSRSKDVNWSVPFRPMRLRYKSRLSKC